jgi:hypothetical protein
MKSRYSVRFPSTWTMLAPRREIRKQIKGSIPSDRAGSCFTNLWSALCIGRFVINIVSIICTYVRLCSRVRCWVQVSDSEPFWQRLNWPLIDLTTVSWQRRSIVGHGRSETLGRVAKISMDIRESGQEKMNSFLAKLYFGWYGWMWGEWIPV